MVTNEMMEVCLQPVQEKFVKISLLQNFFVNEGGYQVRKFRKVGEVQGNTIGGSINIDANSAIRRTCSIDMVITDSSFLVSEDSKVFIDKWFKVELGIRSLKTDEIVWFNKGIYAIHNPSVKYNATEKILHIEGLDLMHTLDSTSLGIITKLPADISLADAVKTTVWQLGKISQSQIYIEQNEYELPYDIEKTPTDTVYSILEEIKNLYMSQEMFFDVEGRFVYRKMRNRYVKNPVPNYENDVITFNFLEDHDLVVDYNTNFLFDNVKNKIIVWGRMLDNGEQIHYELVNDNDESPFSINKNLGIIPLTIVDDKIQTQEQAKLKCEYELYLCNNMCEQISIELSPLLFLDVNQLIEFNKPEINLKGKFLVDSITIPLESNRTASLTAHKHYPVE